MLHAHRPCSFCIAMVESHHRVMSHPNVVSSSQSHSPSPIIAYEVYKTCAKDIIHAPTPSSCTKCRKCTSRTSYTLCVCAPTPDDLTHAPNDDEGSSLGWHLVVHRPPRVLRMKMSIL